MLCKLARFQSCCVLLLQRLGASRQVSVEQSQWSILVNPLLYLKGVGLGALWILFVTRIQLEARFMARYWS